MICTLETDAFRWTVAPGDLTKAIDEWAEVKHELILKEGYSGALQANTLTYAPLKDWIRLVEYLSGYIAYVRTNPGPEDCCDEFVPIDLSFSAMICDGGTSLEEEGEATVAIHVNVGRDVDRVYTGAECQVSFSAVLSFAAEIRALVDYLTRVSIKSSPETRIDLE